MTRNECEISWLFALCDNDYEFRGFPAENRRTCAD
jgi:hypothetical protein